MSAWEPRAADQKPAEPAAPAVQDERRSARRQSAPAAALALFDTSAGRPLAPASALAGDTQLVLTGQMPFGLGEPPILGPLQPGTTLESHGLTVTQTDAQHADIAYGDSWVRIAAEPGDVYVFTIGPPIEGPPKPEQLIALPGGPGFVPFADPFAEPQKPELAQRLLRVDSTRPIVDQHIDDARVPPLAVQTRFASAKDIAGGFGFFDKLDVDEYVEGARAQLRLEDSMITIEPAANASAVAGDASRAHYAYWIDPEWTGRGATEKRVVIVAAPGVLVRTGEPENHVGYPYGRKLVAELARVPHPALVPKQGTRISLEQFVSVDVVDPDAPEGPLAGFPGHDSGGQHTNAVEIGTGLGGVVIAHPWSGARLTLQPVNRGLGAAYAWQVVPPLNGAPGEIRAIVGPGVAVELAEPLPNRLRQAGGPTPTPRPGQARTGEGLEEQAFELKLVEVVDPALVPVQGTPLNTEHFLLSGGRPREPDRHVWLGTDDLSFMIATAVADAVISAIPIVGQLYQIGEFAYAAATGHDWWGNEIDDGSKVMMGFGAALSLIPLVGGLSRLLRGAAEASKIAQLAERLGTTTEELQAVLVRVGASVEGDEAAVVQRAMNAIVRGEELAEEDAPALQRVLGKVGAGRLGIGGIARSGIGKLDLALAAAGEPLKSESYLANLVSAYRTTGEIPESLVLPLAQSGHFGSAEEAGTAVQQALRDLARAEGVAADEGLIAKVAEDAGKATGRVQTAAIAETTPQTRRIAVARPDLVAEYEKLIDAKLPSVMQGVLARQAATPNRTLLAQLRVQFDQLRRQVGGAQRLTDAQRDAANTILRQARRAAGEDFDNVQKAVWRRLRNAREHPDLAAIEGQLRAQGDVSGPRSGALRLHTVTAAGEESFEPMNIEHRVRRSDNPWLYNDPRNLLATDAAQNQQYLESLRKQGSVWPSGEVEDFVVRYGLNDEGWDFRPGPR